MRATRVALGRKLANGVYRSEILAPVGFDDYRRIRWRGYLAIPPKELLPVTAKRYFYELHGFLICSFVIPAHHSSFRLVTRHSGSSLVSPARHSSFPRKRESL
jgi:hypothetical protein